MQTQNSKMAEFDWAQLPNRVLAIELSLRIVNENTQRAYGLAAAAQEASVRATQKVDSLNITGLSGVEDRFRTIKAQSNIIIGELAMISNALTEAILEVRKQVDAIGSGSASAAPFSVSSQELINPAQLCVLGW
jgi:hypothetical protein